MILGKALILKGLAGVTALGSAVTIGVVGNERGWFRRSIDPALKELIEKVGLSCNLNNICTQVSGKTTNIKKDSELVEKTFETSGTGKIKVYKDTSTSNPYNQGFKFVIEGGDVSFKSNSTHKLEQFETYEIKEEGTDPNKKWYFSRKTEAKDEIKKALGLPTESSCTFPTTSSNPSNCSSIDVAKLKAINFEGKGTTEPTIESSGTSATLKIAQTTDTTNFPLGYKFTFGGDKNISIPKTSGNIFIKKNSDTEFKIKVTPSSGTTPVKLSLEKAWTVTTLGAKVGLVCPDPKNEEKCSFKDGSININNSNSSKKEGTKLKTGFTDKKMTYEEDQEGYNQGFKFTVEGGASIELDKDGETGTIPSIENSGTGYEIKEESGNWYLTKKTGTPS